MLKKIKILNFAILKNIEFLPKEGLNILTGETGSGKSLLIDAINLVLGKRTDYKFKDNQKEKCIIEATFNFNENLKNIFLKNDLDIDESIIIRREILNSGKSRAFVNDTPVQISVLKNIGEKLISIHSQFDNSDVVNNNFHYKILDIDNQKIYTEYSQKFKLYKQLIQDKNVLELSILNYEKEKDYLKYLFNELEKLNLKIDEENELDEEINFLTNADEIQKTASISENIINEGEYSIIENLNSLKQILKPITISNKKFYEIFERIASVQIELKDILKEIDSVKDLAQSNPERLNELNERLNEIQMLKRKHQVNDIENLLIIKSDLEQKIFMFSNHQNYLEDLTLKIQKLESELNQLCENLFDKRNKNSKIIEKKIKNYLELLEIPNCDFEYKITKTSDFNINGKDEIEILFSANKGIAKQNIAKSASGGEISRLALSLRAIESEKSIGQTYIFDEIDTGVSGKVASQIGQMMTKLSEKNQLICITHIPQVAGYANAHFNISKSTVENTTISNISYLNSEDRIEILASMLSNEITTLIAKENAKELIKN